MSVSNSAATERRSVTVAQELRRLRPLPGDILLFHHPERLRSVLISLCTASPYYHVGIYAGNGEVIEARLPAVVKRNLYHEKDGYRFVVLRAPHREAGIAALNWAREHIGARYDLGSLFRWALARILHRPSLCGCNREGCYVCGNFVVIAYQAAGVDLFPGRAPAEIVPADFAPLLHQMRRPIGNARRYAGRRSICLSSATLLDARSASSSLMTPAL